MTTTGAVVGTLVGGWLTYLASIRTEEKRGQHELDVIRETDKLQEALERGSVNPPSPNVVGQKHDWIIEYLIIEHLGIS